MHAARFYFEISMECLRGPLNKNCLEHIILERELNAYSFS